MLKDLMSEYKNTKIIFERMDLMNLNMNELTSLMQRINLKMQYIDLFINGSEILLEMDLQKSMNINMVSFY